MAFDLKKHVQYNGRFDFSDSLGPIFDWSGSSFITRFKGTAIRLVVNPEAASGNDWIYAILDDKAPVPIRIVRDQAEYEIAAGLADTEHKLEIYKWTEALIGKLQLVGFELPAGGEFLPPKPGTSRKMEILGDSITSGGGVETPELEGEAARAYGNNYLAYSSIAARALGAEHSTVSISGIGIYQSYGGDKRNTLPDHYHKTALSLGGSKWDFTQWIPEVVVINLGTNDTSAEIDVPAFKQKYCDFVKRIRGNYPEAHIFCTIGSMTVEPGPYIEGAVQLLRQAGDHKVHYVQFELINIETEGEGVNFHPSLKTHETMAAKLVQAIRSEVGW